MNLLLWSLLVFGITIIITKSHLMRKFRLKLDNIHEELGYMSTCPMCTGFWVGILLSLISPGASNFFLFDGFIASAICTILWSMVDYNFESQKQENVED